MGKDSKISWCDHTFNPWIGCQKVSEGCRGCYAEREMTRKPRWANCWGAAATTDRLKTSDDYWQQPYKWNRGAEKAGERKRVFCASLADVFEDNPQVEDWRYTLFHRLIWETHSLDWLVLTKRIEVAKRFFEQYPDFLKLDNLRIGTSAENQEQADARIPTLLEIPLPNFVSVEPMLGPVNLNGYLGYCLDCDNYRAMHGEYGVIYHDDDPRLDWVIVGAESGPNRRPCKSVWIRDAVRQYQRAGVPVFVKQINFMNKVSKDMDEWSPDLRVQEFPR